MSGPRNQGYSKIYWIRHNLDWAEDDTPNEDLIGLEMPRYFNTRNYSRRGLRSYVLPTVKNIEICRESGGEPDLVPYDYEIDRPIQFSNDIRVAFIQYQSMLQRSLKQVIDEMDNKSLSHKEEVQRYEREQKKALDAALEQEIQQRTIPLPKSINNLADDVSQQVIAKAFPQAATRIKYLSEEEPNLDIVRFLEEGFATRDIDTKDAIDTNSTEWQTFMNVFEEAKMQEGIEYTRDLSGYDLSHILEEYAEDFYDLQKAKEHASDPRQYYIHIPPQWASPQVRWAAKWIQRQRVQQSSAIPELIPFDHKHDNIQDLKDLDDTEEDEMLTQAALLAASTTSNYLDHVKDITITDSIKPYVQYEQNVLNMLTTAQNIILKNIYDRQSQVMLKLKAYKPTLEREIEILREFDKDALHRFDRMHDTHRELLLAVAHGSMSRNEMLLQVRDNIIREYHQWLQTDESHEKYPGRETTYLEHRMATEMKIEKNAVKNIEDIVNTTAGRDSNTTRMRDAYLDRTKEERSDLLLQVNTALLGVKKELISVVDDEFTKLDMFLNEVSYADKELDMYVDKIMGLKLEWDRYSLLTKAAVIKALVLQNDDPEEADEILDSANKAIFNMEYLKKVIHVIGTDLVEVADIAGKRVHNQYCHFDPTLVPYQLPKDPQTGNIIGLTYPVPEPYILSPNIIVPTEHQHFSLGGSNDGFGLGDGKQALDGSEYNVDKWKQQQMSVQERIQTAMGQDPFSQTLNPNVGFLPEDIEMLETTKFEDRVPHRIPDSGMGGWEQAFKTYLMDTGVESLDSAGASTFGISGKNIVEMLQHAINDGYGTDEELNTVQHFIQQQGELRKMFTIFGNNNDGNENENNNNNEKYIEFLNLEEKLKTFATEGYKAVAQRILHNSPLKQQQSVPCEFKEDQKEDEKGEQKQQHHFVDYSKDVVLKNYIKKLIQIDYQQHLENIPHRNLGLIQLYHQHNIDNGSVLVNTDNTNTNNNNDTNIITSVWNNIKNQLSSFFIKGSTRRTVLPSISTRNTHIVQPSQRVTEIIRNHLQYQQEQKQRKAYDFQQQRKQQYELQQLQQQMNAKNCNL